MIVDEPEFSSPAKKNHFKANAGHLAFSRQAAKRAAEPQDISRKPLRLCASFWSMELIFPTSADECERLFFASRFFPRSMRMHRVGRHAMRNDSRRPHHMAIDE
jgi:hypothetical protein